MAWLKRQQQIKNIDVTIKGVEVDAYFSSISNLSNGENIYTLEITAERGSSLDKKLEKILGVYND